MTTTVNLLSTYTDPSGTIYPPYTILDLPDDVAAKLLAGGIGATTNLTGGVRRTREVALTGLDQGTPSTLSASSKSTIAVPPNRLLVLTGSYGTTGTATSTDPQGKSTSLPLKDGALVFGPYTSQGSVEVSVTAGSVVVNTVESLSQRPVGNTAVLVGDSITAQNYALAYISQLSRSGGIATIKFTGSQLNFLAPGSPIQVENVPEDFRGRYTLLDGATDTWRYNCPGPDVAAYTPTGNPHILNLAAFASNGWFTNGNAAAKQRFELVGISAAVGRATPEVLARIGEVTSVPAANAFVLAGINDIEGGGATEDIIRNLRAIYTALLSSGKRVYALTILPLRSTKWTQVKADKIIEVNNWILETAASTPGMRALDMYSRLVDSVSTNKGEAKDFVLSPDFIHPSANGAQLMGIEMEEKTRDIPQVDRRVKSNGENYGTNTRSKNVLDNAPWASGGTNGAGLGYSGITEGASAPTFTTPARSDGIGLANKVVYTPTANNDGARFNSTNISPPRLFAGVTLQSEVSISASGLAAGKAKALRHYLVVTLPGSVNIFLNAYTDVGAGSTGNYAPQVDMTDWVFRTPAVKFDVAPTTSYVLSGLASSGAGSAVTFEASRGQVRAT